jgi:glycosyltransferase involved in cell wall biosynthesis
VPAASSGVVPPAIEASLWTAPPRDVDASRPLRLAFVGGHFERKGGKILLDVFRSRLRGRCELTIATRDPIPEEAGVRVLRGLSAGSEGLRTLLREADAFVLPTLADCHSIASLEAMASGLPVVLARIGAGPEIVEEGRSGFLVDAGKGEPLAAAIEALAADRTRARAMGERGRAMVLEKFDTAALGARVAAELQAAVAAGEAPARAFAVPSRS